jgi:hypothetical protein
VNDELNDAIAEAQRLAAIEKRLSVIEDTLATLVCAFLDRDEGSDIEPETHAALDAFLSSVSPIRETDSEPPESG